MVAICATVTLYVSDRTLPAVSCSFTASRGAWCGSCWQVTVPAGYPLEGEVVTYTVPAAGVPADGVVQIPIPLSFPAAILAGTAPGTMVQVTVPPGYPRAGATVQLEVPAGLPADGVVQVPLR